MKKFIVLLNKEVRELLTLQMIAPLIISVILFGGIGKIIASQTEKADAVKPLVVMDLDQSATSKQIIDSLKGVKFAPKMYDQISIPELIKKAQDEKSSAAVVIPAGFESKLQNGEQAPIETYNIMRTLSFLGGQSNAVLTSAVQAINGAISNQLITQKLPGSNPDTLKNPLTTQEYVVVKDRYAQGNMSAVFGFVTGQTALVPVILFIVIMMAAQMIATSMASEKENKTLETLLTLPVSRKAIVTAKLMASGIVALLFALVYLFGFRSYMNGLTGMAGTQVDAQGSISQIVNQLGLSFNTTSYILLGLSLFAAILCALAIAIILGSFATDVKSVQSIISPLMILIMIPYLLTLFVDFTTLPRIAQWAVYAIPFSHPFLASQQLLFHQYPLVIAGIIYQFAVFAVFVVIASRLFASEKLLTMRLNFGKKKSVVREG